MFFGKKKKEDNKDIEEIKKGISEKRAVSEEEFLPKEFKPSELEEVSEPLPGQMDTSESDKPTTQALAPEREVEIGKELPPKMVESGEAKPVKSAPLFVKIEKYDEIIRNVEEIKILISGIKQVFDILNELEIIRNDAIKINRATLQRLEKTLFEMDSEFLRPRDVSAKDLGVEDVETAKIEDALTDLQKQLHSLRNHLETLK